MKMGLEEEPRPQHLLHEPPTPFERAYKGLEDFDRKIEPAALLKAWMAPKATHDSEEGKEDVAALMLLDAVTGESGSRMVKISGKYLDGMFLRDQDRQAKPGRLRIVEDMASRPYDGSSQKRQRERNRRKYVFS